MIRLILILWLLCTGVPVWAQGTLFDLKLTSPGASYLKVLDRTMVPLPQSAIDTRVTTEMKILESTPVYVNGVYSPSVVKVGKEYLMFFGADIRCTVRAETLARDTIGLATSADGIRWKFKKWLLEPDASVCTKPWTQLNDGVAFQMNDPSAYLSPDGTGIYLFYTVAWHHKSRPTYPHSYSCGTIGLIIYDLNLNTLARNDRYLEPNDIQGACDGEGFSRPDLQWRGPGTTYLWLDTFALVKRAPVMSLNRLESETVELTGTGGVDVHLPAIDYNSTHLLANGASQLGPALQPILYKQIKVGPFGTYWTDPLAVTRLSGSSWDSSYQGSPWLYLDRDSCKAKLYFAGSRIDGSNNNVLSIGVAVPPADAVYRFPLCR